MNGFDSRRIGVILALAFAMATGGCDDGEDEMDGGVDAGMDGAMAPPDGGDDDDDADVTPDEDAGPDAGMDAAMLEDAGDADVEPTDGGPVGGGAATSAQIQAVRDAAEGTIDLAIDDAIVTYLKPNIGDDPAGFFLQAQPMGPAVFVRIDPSTLTPPAEVGQVVDLRVTDTQTDQGRREIVALEDWNVDSSGHDVSFLVQDVSDVDLTTMLGDFESELVTATFSLNGPFRNAGTGFQKVTVNTAGVPEAVTVTLRLPDAVAESFVFEPGCRFTVTGTPLWRLDVEAQLTAFDAGELSVAECDAPVVTIASAINERSAVVRFTRPIDAASVMADGSQFTITHAGTSDIPVTSATAVDGETFIVIEADDDLEAGEFYEVTVASTVLDTRGTGVDAAMSSFIFGGFEPHLVINEVDYDQPGTDSAEFVEIHNPSLETAISLTGMTLFTINGEAGTATEASVDLSTNSGALTELAPGAYLLVTTPSSGGLTIPTGVATVALGANLQNDAEGVVLTRTSGPPADRCQDAVFYEAIPTAAAFMGCAYESNAGTDPASADGSLSRIPDGADAQQNSVDFRVVAPTPGAANAL